MIKNKLKPVLLSVLMGVSLSSLAYPKDGITPLKDDPTDEEMTVVRNGAKNWCEDLMDSGKITEDGREECVMDYFVQHNLDEEPSCD
jgi:hypothetical protein